MLSFLPGPILGLLSFSLYAVNTLFWGIPIMILTVLKLCIPGRIFRNFCNRMLNGIATHWISVNTFNQWLVNKTRIEVTGVDPGQLKLNDWYLVISNHQSWVDILVLQRIFNRNIPFFKFFVKKELIWVPVLGLIWWALDYPFMKRYSGEFLRKNPHLRGKDIEITRKYCEKFRDIPVSIMIFVEGTRFTPAKHQKQGSPYKNLLKPRAGGMAFVLGAMGEQLRQLVNVTIVYPDGNKTFWEFLCGKVTEIKVRVEVLPIPKEMTGDYFNDTEFKESFQTWLNTAWQEKDQLIESLRPPARF
jgi:1-acyl-sn-glycerol-3-phosphate acyltransferase